MQSDFSFPTSTSSPLVPQRIVEVLDRTFRIYRANFIGFITISAMVLIPVAILTVLLTQSAYDDIRRFGVQRGYPASYWLLIVVGIVGQFIATVVVNGITTYITAENHLGREASIGEAFQQVRPRMWTIAGGLFLFGLLLGVIFFAVSFIGALCFVVPLVVFPVMFYLLVAGYFYLIPVLVLENVGVSNGINRAMWLGKSRFWQTLGLFILVYIILFCVGFLIGIFNGLIPGSNSTFSFSVNVAQVAIQTIASILTAPVMTIAMTVMYFDTRVRVEGLDIAFETVPSPEPRVSDVISPTPTARLLAWKDLGNAILLTVAFIAVVMVLGLSAQALLTNFVGF